MTELREKLNQIAEEKKAKIIPENIKANVQIFDVTGTYKAEGLDTSDATATAGDILKDKTAYVNGEKITGNLEIKETTNITKGLIINECDENGYPTDVSIVGMTEIPDYFLEGRALGDTAFTYCTKLKLPEALTRIGNYAFQYCRNLALTKLPEEIEEISMYGFADCYKLAITEIPSKVTLLRNYAFQNCTSLTEITWTSSEVGMGTNVFKGCTNLRKFAMPNITSVPTLNSVNVFTSTPIASDTGYIYVPDNLVESFKTATNWSTYADQIKGVSELV